MKLLLDTHAILWFWWDDPRLGSQAREAIANASNQKLVSILPLLGKSPSR